MGNLLFFVQRSLHHTSSHSSTGIGISHESQSSVLHFRTPGRLGIETMVASSKDILKEEEEEANGADEEMGIFGNNGLTDDLPDTTPIEMIWNSANPITLIRMNGHEVNR